MIRYNFDIKKIVQIVNFLLKLNDYKLNYTKLIKLLYLADREALKLWDTTISKDSYSCLNKGPVLSNLYDLIKEKSTDKNQCHWNNYFIKHGYDLKSIIKDNLPKDEISPREIELLKKIDKYFKSYSYGDMIEYCHKNCPEWDNPDCSSKTLSVNEILKALGRTEEEIKELEEENKVYYEEDMLLKNNG